MSGKTPSVKAAAAEALAVLAFVGSEHPSDSLEVAQHLQRLWKGNDFPSLLQLQGEHEPTHSMLVKGPSRAAGLLRQATRHVLLHDLCIALPELRPYNAHIQRPIHFTSAAG